MQVYPKTSRKLIIFGAAEIADLAQFYFDLDSDYETVAFVVDDEYVTGERLNGLPVVPWSEAKLKFPPSDYVMHVALSYKRLNQLRMEKFEQCKNAGYDLVSYLSTKASYWPDLKFGDTCFILEGQNLQPRVKLGANVMLWSGNHIGHGTTIASHSYISSQVVISGHVVVEERCFVGVNASIRDFITIGADSFIGMGSIVTRDLVPGSVVLPARSEIINGSDIKASRLIKSTFGFKE